jgi:hypothetical protein
MKIGKFGVAVIAFCLGVGISLFGPDVFLRIIHGKPEESVTEVANGPFKVLIRSQDFHHSATVNIDICVSQSSSRTFPKDRAQCFFHGYDFSGLLVRWHSQREIEVSFDSGSLSEFKNYAFVDPKGSLPVEFHITMHDERPYPH